MWLGETQHQALEEGRGSVSGGMRKVGDGQQCNFWHVSEHPLVKAELLKLGGGKRSVHREEGPKYIV